MPISFTCRKCGKSHSKDDYDKSRFCTACGSFLIQEYSGKPTAVLTRNETRQKPTESTSRDRIAIRRAAESLRQRISQTREYEIRSEPEKPAETTHITVESWIWNSEYDDALKLEKTLLSQYKDRKLEEALPGKTISNEQGDCYCLSDTCVAKFKKATCEESQRLIISDLKIIPGIGPAREHALKEQGYSTIQKLTEHPIWKKPAQKFMEQIEAKEIGSIQSWLWKRLPKSHPLAHYLAGFCNEEDFAIIDIETLGLSERPIILLGIAKPTEKRICVSQFLLRDIPDEPSAIWGLMSQLEARSSLITFNGKSFDLPYIKQRLAYYGIDASLSNPHFDLLHFTRRAMGKRLNNCRLETVEKYLGIKRGINIPGALVPHFYDTYLKTRNVGPLVAIAEHNKQDLLTLGNLFSRLYEEWDL